MKTETTFVLIVGGGPVGLTAAIELGQRGVPAILVTQNTETATHPKCNFVNARTMEHYRRMGFAAEVRQHGVPPDYPREVAYRTRFCGPELGRLVLPLPKLDGGQAPFAEFPHNGSQIVLEPVLKRQAEAQSSVSVRFGWRLESLTIGADSSLARVRNLATGEEQEIVASYVIGADGARSPVRKAMGVDLEGEDGSAPRDFMSGTLLTFFFRAPDLLNRTGSKPAILTWIVNPELRAFVFAQDGKERWIAHYQVPHDTDWQAVDADATLKAILGADIAYEMLSLGPWSGGLALIAKRFQQGRLFLAGDAAHLFTPLGGFGLNTGVGDAVNLAWKLAAVHDGWASDDILDSYEAERRPIAWRNTRLGLHCAQRKAGWEIPPGIEAPGEEAQAVRSRFGRFCVEDDADEYATLGLMLGERYETSPIVVADDAPAPPDDWARYVPIERAGARLPLFRMPDGGLVYDALGAGYTLIEFIDGADAGSRRAEWRAAAGQRGIPLTVLACPRPEPSPFKSRWVLVRPDQHIAWHGDALDESLLDLMQARTTARV